MLRIKSAQFGRGDFNDVGVRRLSGALTDVQGYASQALERLEAYKAEGRLDLGLQDIRQDDDLRYWLPLIFGNEWEGMVLMR